MAGYALHMSTTQEQVSEAADQLVANGQRASVRAVRRLLGGGSPNVLSKHLRAWRGGRHKPAAVPAPDSMIKEIAPVLWTSAMAAARKAVQGELDLMAASLKESNDANDELQGLVDEAAIQLGHARAERQSIIDQAQLEREASAQQIAHLRAQLTERDAECRRLGDLAAASQEALKVQQGQCSRLAEDLAALERARDRDQDRNRFSLEECARLAAEQAKTHQELMERHSIVVDVAARAKQEVISLAEQVVSSRGALQRAEQEFEATVSRLRSEVISLTHDLGKRDGQIQTLAGALSNERGLRVEAERKCGEILAKHEATIEVSHLLKPLLEELERIHKARRDGPTDIQG